MYADSEAYKPLPGELIMNDNAGQTTFFYSRHPISADIIVTKLQAARGHLRDVRPEELGRTIRTITASARGALVGLEEHVRILQGDALDDGSMDAVVSQEAFVHSSTKRAWRRRCWSAHWREASLE
jgi:hypothetical protein